MNTASESSTLPFLRGGHLVALALVMVALTPLAAGAQMPGCSVDSATGVPVVQSKPGLCVARTGTQTVLVQSTDDGLLLAAMDAGADDFGQPNRDGMAPMYLYNRDAKVIFCPLETVDAATGAPSRDCLWSLESMSPGSSALVGSGLVFASAVVDTTGRARCPSSVAVMAQTISPGGDDLNLASSLALSPVGRWAGEDRQQLLGCEVTRQEVRLGYGSGVGEDRVHGQWGEEGGTWPDSRSDVSDSLADELGWLRELNDDDWTLVSELIRLDDQEWDVLHRLLSLDASQAADLEARLRTDGAAVLTDDGGVAPVNGAGSDTSGTVVTTEDIDGILDNILARVNSILSTVSSISGRIPNRSDIRELIMNGSFITRIATVIQRVQELIGGVLDVAATLRDGFEAWHGSSCDPSSQCAAFKSDLASLISDFGDATEFLQSLSCLEQPGLEIRRPDLSLLQTLIVDNAPPVLLFSLYKVLERIDPAGAGDSGWQGLIRDVLDEVPSDFQTKLRELCAQEAEAPDVGGSSGLVCSILRPEEVGLFLKAARFVAYRKVQTAKLINSFFKDDVVAQADAVAGGGGGAGTNVKNPPKVVSERAKDLADDFPEKFSNFIELRDQCIEADSDIESDLRDCQPPVSVLLQTTLNTLPPHPTFEDVEAVIALRLRQVRKCKSDGLCAELRDKDAADYLALAGSSAGTLGGYRYLCCAYQALNGGTQIQCPSP